MKGAMMIGLVAMGLWLVLPVYAQDEEEVTVYEILLAPDPREVLEKVAKQTDHILEELLTKLEAARAALQAHQRTLQETLHNLGECQHPGETGGKLLPDVPKPEARP